MAHLGAPRARASPEECLETIEPQSGVDLAAVPALNYARLRLQVVRAANGLHPTKLRAICGCQMAAPVAIPVVARVSLRAVVAVLAAAGRMEKAQARPVTAAMVKKFVWAENSTP